MISCKKLKPSIAYNPTLAISVGFFSSDEQISSFNYTTINLIEMFSFCNVERILVKMLFFGQNFEIIYCFSLKQTFEKKSNNLIVSGRPKSLQSCYTYFNLTVYVL